MEAFFAAKRSTPRTTRSYNKRTKLVLNLDFTSQLKPVVNQSTCALCKKEHHPYNSIPFCFSTEQKELQLFLTGFYVDHFVITFRPDCCYWLIPQFYKLSGSSLVAIFPKGKIFSCTSTLSRFYEKNVGLIQPELGIQSAVPT